MKTNTPTPTPRQYQRQRPRYGQRQTQPHINLDITNPNLLWTEKSKNTWKRQQIPPVGKQSTKIRLKPFVISQKKGDATQETDGTEAQYRQACPSLASSIPTAASRLASGLSGTRPWDPSGRIGAKIFCRYSRTSFQNLDVFRLVTGAHLFLVTALRHLYICSQHRKTRHKTEPSSTAALVQGVGAVTLSVSGFKARTKDK